MRGWIYLIALAVLGLWYMLRRMYRKGVLEGDAKRDFRDSEAQVRRLEESGGMDEMREDLLEKARRK